ANRKPPIEAVPRSGGKTQPSFEAGPLRITGRGQRRVTFMLTSEVAQESRESVRTWQRRIAPGDIAVHRVGRRVLIDRDDFTAFMASHRQEARPPEDLRQALERAAAAALAKRRRTA